MDNDDNNETNDKTSNHLIDFWSDEKEMPSERPPNGRAFEGMDEKLRKPFPKEDRNGRNGRNGYVVNGMSSGKSYPSPPPLKLEPKVESNSNQFMAFDGFDDQISRPQYESNGYGNGVSIRNFFNDIHIPLTTTRPILKNPFGTQGWNGNGMPFNGNPIQPNGWYQNFCRSTGRVVTDVTNDYNEKRVHFSEEFDEINGNDKDDDNDDDSPQQFYHFPHADTKWSTKDSFVNTFRTVLNNIESENKYFNNQWDKNAEQIRNNKQNHNNLLSDSLANIWSKPANAVIGALFTATTSTLTSESRGKVQEAMDLHRKISAKEKAMYTWSGQLPRKIRNKEQMPVHSVKVFLGGIPYDLTDGDLHINFQKWGPIQIQWPGKDIKSAIDGAVANRAGYVYIIFESYDKVAALLKSCKTSYGDDDIGNRWFFTMASRRQHAKEVQVIPFDIGDRFYMKVHFSGQMEHSRTVFVGGLHGMLSADGLAKVMDDLFGGVEFAGLDTDKYKYPLGSGRVYFDNHESYLRAINAGFVEVKSARFKKKLQIDPYIDNEHKCCVCELQLPSPVYCRDCSRYYCENCWEVTHKDEVNGKVHRPMTKSKQSAHSYSQS